MKDSHNASAKRPYRMRVRAATAEDTHRRIVHAALTLYGERWIDQITLDEVAAQAGVTMQTVLRRFGSKDGLLAAAGNELERQVVQQRFAAPIGDVAGAISNLFDHYEQVGDLMLRSLAQEGRHAPLRALIDRGRQIHHEWVARTFAPLLAAIPGQEGERRLAQLVTVTDIYVWKLLRRDLGLNREQAALAIRELIDGLRSTRAMDTAQGGGEDA